MNKINEQIQAARHVCINALRPSTLKRVARHLRERDPGTAVEMVSIAEGMFLVNKALTILGLATVPPHRLSELLVCDMAECRKPIHSVIRDAINCAVASYIDPDNYYHVLSKDDKAVLYPRFIEQVYLYEGDAEDFLSSEMGIRLEDNLPENIFPRSREVESIIGMVAFEACLNFLKHGYGSNTARDISIHMEIVGEEITISWKNPSLEKEVCPPKQVKANINFLPDSTVHCKIVENIYELATRLPARYFVIK